MAWQLVHDEPIRIDGPWPATGAHRVASAIREYAVPILRAVAERLVPLATGSLLRVDRELYLLTAGHVFDAGARLGDMRVPLGHGRLLPLEPVAERLTRDADDDIAVLRLRTRAAREALLAHWRALAPGALASGRADLYAICGYPAVRSRWVEGRLHSKPVTFYTRGLADIRTMPIDAVRSSKREHLLSFSRVGTRADDADVYTPALEGVSGATAWAIAEHDDGGGEGPRARVRPVGIQVSYRHGEFVRCTDWQRVADLIDRLDPPAAREIRRRFSDCPAGGGPVRD